MKRVPNRRSFLALGAATAASCTTPVQTIDQMGAETEIVTKGRHDPCVAIRGAPVVEAMMALVLADQKLLHRGQCGGNRG